MIAIRTEREIDILRQANQIVANVLVTLADAVKAGTTTRALDDLAEEMILASGATPAFKGYHGYPAATCISVDEVIVHGIPGDQVLQAGQIVSIDVGTCFKGYYGDAAISVACGTVDDERQRLMTATDRSLAAAIAAARDGNYLRDIGRAVEKVCAAEGFSIVRAFVGHGIGTQMHEDPQVPNFDTGQQGPQLKSGMVLALEPMINAGTHRVKVMEDGWTALTADGRPSAHFEHSVVVREAGGEILSYTAKRRWGQRE